MRDVERSTRMQIPTRVQSHLVDSVGHVDAERPICVTQRHLGQVRQRLENTPVPRPHERVALRARDRRLPERRQAHEVDRDDTVPRPCTRHAEILYEIDALEKRAPEPLQADVAEIGSCDGAHETVLLGRSVGRAVVEIVPGHGSA